MSINKDQLRELITETLKEINLYSESAVELLMGTAAVESNLGTYIKQVKGPALGVFQMEPATHDDIWKNYIKYKGVDLRSDIFESAKTLKIHDELLVYNLKYAIIMARIHYLRVPKPLPNADDLNGLAEYWKKYFNTHLGKGKPSDFINKYIWYVSAVKKRANKNS